eukprot:GCRY01000297.1.p1 GENE.GCRY01000297.1~~GCRY01000297.1.p1  ORF type:complete len:513 (+),score=111.91 GCRY01000297.1:164-1702(+)
MKSLFVLLTFCLLASSSTALNVTLMHVTDVHGWVYGHRHMPALDADYGDLSSFVTHMKADCEKNQREFLLFDTGDILEGTGLSDSTPVHGEYIFPVVMEAVGDDLTGATVGNHDLMHNSEIEGLIQNFANPLGKRYITSNTIIAKTKQPLSGNSYQVMETKLGTKILLLGYIYNFKKNADDVIVVNVNESLQEPYFKEAMQQDVDMIVVMTHIDPEFPPELDQIYAAIRKHQPNIPLILLTGHRHVTYFNQRDSQSFTIESAKYFQKIGLVNFELNNRRMSDVKHEWMDTTVANMMQKTGFTDVSAFTTARAQSIKALIQKYISVLGLDYVYGCSPRYYDPYVSLWKDDSFYGLFLNHIIPQTIFTEYHGTHTPFFITNSAALRSPLYEGKIIKDDVFSISPFNDTFFLVPNVQGDRLKNLLAELIKENLQVNDAYDDLEILGDSKLPHFVWQFVSISEQALYDLVVAEYDSTRMVSILNQLYPGSAFGRQPLGSYTSTIAIQDYIEKNMKC